MVNQAPQQGHSDNDKFRRCVWGDGPHGIGHYDLGALGYLKFKAERERQPFITYSCSDYAPASRPSLDGYTWGPGPHGAGFYSRGSGAFLSADTALKELPRAYRDALQDFRHGSGPFGGGYYRASGKVRGDRRFIPAFIPAKASSGRNKVKFGAYKYGSGVLGKQFRRAFEFHVSCITPSQKELPISGVSLHSLRPFLAFCRRRLLLPSIANVSPALCCRLTARAPAAHVAAAQLCPAAARWRQRFGAAAAATRQRQLCAVLAAGAVGVRPTRRC